jgi:hypothetical protein
MRHTSQMAVPVHRDPWVAMQAGVDPHKWARELRRAHEGVVTGGDTSTRLRPTILASWQRSAAGGARPDGAGARDVLDADALADRRRTHPLAAALPAIRSVLHSAMGEAQHIMVVSDESGVLLWVEGPPREISRAADDMNFVPGSDWSEAGVGTNSIGTALATDHAIQVFSAEHYNVACHRWTCSGAPVHDPATGRLVGAIDITSNLAIYHPSGHPLVLAAAQVAERVLAEQQQQRDHRLVDHYLQHVARHTRPPSAVLSHDGRVLAAFPHGWLGARVKGIPQDGGLLARQGVVATPILDGDGYVVAPAGRAAPSSATTAAAPTLEVTALGRRTATCRLWGRTIELSRRHSEILVLLALHPEGLSGQEISDALYADAVTPVTVRVEISRLRHQIGDVIASRPYRLRNPVDADFLRLRDSLDADADADADAAVAAAGPLLPGSTVPQIVALRDRLSAGSR